MSLSLCQVGPRSPTVIEFWLSTTGCPAPVVSCFRSVILLALLPPLCGFHRLTSPLPSPDCGDSRTSFHQRSRYRLLVGASGTWRRRSGCIWPRTRWSLPPVSTHNSSLNPPYIFRSRIDSNPGTLVCQAISANGLSQYSSRPRMGRDRRMECAIPLPFAKAPASCSQLAISALVGGAISA